MRQAPNRKLEAFGKRMQNLRRNEEDTPGHEAMSRRAFVERAGELGYNVSVDWITAIELGQRKDVTLSDVVILSKVLGLQPIRVLCDLSRPFNEADLPAFRGLSNIEVVGDFYCLGDGIETYALLGPDVLAARKLELALKTYEDSLDKLESYFPPDKPIELVGDEDDEEHQRLLRQAFPTMLHREANRGHLDVIDGFVQMVKPWRDAVKASGVRFDGTIMDKYRVLRDDQFAKFLLKVQERNRYDRNLYAMPIVTEAPEAPGEGTPDAA